jgi:ankyrin repeat protein
VLELSRAARVIRFCALALLLASAPAIAAPKPRSPALKTPEQSEHRDAHSRGKNVAASLRAALDAAIQADRGADARALAEECIAQAGDPCDLASALITAIRRAKPNVAVALLQAGTPANVYDADGESALALAAERGNSSAVRALLRAGANFETRLPGGDFPMHRAAMYGRGNVIDMLVAEGADVNAVIRSDVRRDGWTPLMVAAAEGQLASVERLLIAGAQVDARNTRGRTALFIASWYGSKPIVERLMRAGADPTVIDAIGITPRDVGRLIGDPIIVGYLRAKPRH